MHLPGLGVTVGWGLPYFRGPVATPARDHVPVDRRASQAAGHPVSVLLDAIRFPSDTNGMLLEQNDAVLLLRSDNPAHIHDAHERLVGNLDVWQPTSIRRGFVGGGFDGGEALPHKLAVVCATHDPLLIECAGVEIRLDDEPSAAEASVPGPGAIVD